MYRSVRKTFSSLTLDELYAIIALREKVFVVEQNCAYLDADGLDQEAFHILYLSTKDDALIGYARVLPPGTKYNNRIAIGRVVVDRSYRGKGLGRALMNDSILAGRSRFGNLPIQISAQTYLESFYLSLCFRDTGEHYLEDGIPHMAMVLDAD